MNSVGKKQKKMVYRSYRLETFNQSLYNSSGKRKRPVLFDSQRDPFSFVVDWQLEDSDSELLE